MLAERLRLLSESNNVVRWCSVLFMENVWGFSFFISTMLGLQSGQVVQEKQQSEPFNNVVHRANTPAILVRSGVSLASITFSFRDETIQSGFV